LLPGKVGQAVIYHLTRISRRWNTNITATGGNYLVEMGRGVLAGK
jgi:hypothetical protein